MHPDSPGTCRTEKSRSQRWMGSFEFWGGILRPYSQGSKKPLKFMEQVNDTMEESGESSGQNRISKLLLAPLNR